MSVTGEISGHTVSVIVDHFTIFAVMVKEHFNAFSDIKGHWAEESIKKMAARGTVKGYPDQTFRPDKNL
ncbi:MAG: S-layer homology domain-containing protein [Syntrophomonas sp.]